MPDTFSRRVVELAVLIPPGRVTTYGTLAKLAGGGAMASRSIGRILSQVPNQRAIPWHRIVYAGGKVWLDHEHKAVRLKMYQKEGIKVDPQGKIKNFEEIFYDFNE